MDIYEPREDSYLLQKYVDKYSNVESVLDIGTGSGIQAITAAKKAKNVIASDINPKAVKSAKLSASIKKIKNITFLESDLFDKIPKKKFDLIIFNPPYLPKMKKVHDIALFTGKRGSETTQKFLDKASEYLKNDGKILLINSSITNQSKIVEAVENNLFKSEILETKHIFFEDIILFLIKKKEILKKLPVTNAKVFSHGKRGIIIKGLYKNKKVAVKIKKPESTATGTIEIESKFLKILNKENIGPTLIEYDKDYLMYYFVEGVFIEDYIKDNIKKDILIMIKDVFDQMYKMDKLGINKFEMHHPVKHIIIDKKPVLLDFERARYTEKPKNVTQFCDYIFGIKELLHRKKIEVDKDSMIELAKKYKDKPTLTKYKNILKLIK